MRYAKPELIKHDELKQVTFSHTPDHHDHHDGHIPPVESSWLQWFLPRDLRS